MKFQYIKLMFVFIMIFCAQIGWAQIPNFPEVIPEIDPIVAKKLEKINNKFEAKDKKGNSSVLLEENEINEDGEKLNSEDREDEQRKIKFDKRQSELPEAKIWGQQFFRDQSISLFTRSRDIKAIDSYLLGIGDELAITIWGATDYSVSVAIDEDGFINLTDPRKGLHIPRLYIKEMKFSEAKNVIKERLNNHVNMINSQISIELNYSRSLTINITGEIFNPGSYTIPAVNTAFNALVAAGGPSQIGSVRSIKVVSSEKKTRILDVYKFMNNPNVADEFFLLNNDYIYVPLAQRVVEIQGAVQRPFFYELIEDENLIELIDYAGGLRPDAYRRNIQILRYENDQETLIDVNLTELLRQEINFELKNGDRINITPIKQAYVNYITVKGAVKLPGTYELVDNTTVYDVLMKAGVIRSAIMDRIYIKRLREDLSLDYIAVNVHKILDNPTAPENQILNPFDEIEVKYKSDFIDDYKVKVYGAVRNQGVYDYSDSLVLMDVLYLANGIKREASNSYIEISRLALDTNGNETYIVIKKFDIGSYNDNLEVKGADTYLLEPYDQIFVRTSRDFEKPKNIRLKGEIIWPGVYTLVKENERVIDILKRAGGCTDVAFLKGTKLIRIGEGLVLLDLDKLQKEGIDSRFNYVLRDGDLIIIPKLKDLISIAGRINHPIVKERAEIAEKELELEIEKAETEIEKKEISLAQFKTEKNNPLKVNVPFHEGKRANFYINEYGAGIDRKLGGRKRLVYVRYANGLVKKTKNILFFKVYPIVEKGAMVYVGTKERKIKKERKPINWYAVIKDTFAIFVSGLTVYALIRAL
ncbi:MAG: SLBB domain-containing protein [Saprospiraceae bacterium]|nr:SLBB domain-containing protein [Saprospiraceae bacterium]